MSISGGTAVSAVIFNLGCNQIKMMVMVDIIPTGMFISHNMSLLTAYGTTGQHMTKIEQKKRQKLERILNAALNLFQTNGFIHTSMDKIAKQANVTKQTVYRYFDSKEALFTAALEAQRLESSNDPLTALDLQDPVLALETFAVGFIRKHLSRKHLANIRLLVSEGPKVPEITRAFYAMGPKRIRARLSLFIEEHFNITGVEDEISFFIAILLSLRMPVLTGLNAPPSQDQIRTHALKAVEVLLKSLDIEAKV